MRGRWEPKSDGTRRKALGLPRLSCCLRCSCVGSLGWLAPPSPSITLSVSITVRCRLAKVNSCHHTDCLSAVSPPPSGCCEDFPDESAKMDFVKTMVGVCANGCEKGANGANVGNGANDDVSCGADGTGQPGETGVNGGAKRGQSWEWSSLPPSEKHSDRFKASQAMDMCPEGSGGGGKDEEVLCPPKTPEKCF